MTTPPCGQALLLHALRLAPRRFRMPALPAHLDAARAAAPEAALAFALEAARIASGEGRESAAGTRDLFTGALAAVIRAALRAEGGDAAFQAQVLRAGEPEVDEYVALAALATSDRRAVRAAVNAFAHPAKLRSLGGGAPDGTLSGLHRLAEAGAWAELAQAAQQLLQDAGTAAGLRAALMALGAQPGLERLRRGAFLGQSPGVRRYLALCERRGPLAGSGAAADHGRASAQLGAHAEDATVQAFGALADLLNQRPGDARRYRAVQGLRVPSGFPGTASHAKGEWDAALVAAGPVPGAAVAITLLAEVKASPGAAAADFPRLHRGLQRLALARADAVHVFACKDGELPILGESLARLRPPDAGLPPQVFYCCAASAEEGPPLLDTASKALLLSEQASLAYAARLAAGGAPDAGELVAVWERLTRAPRLRSVLHQYETALGVREAMLHPQDLPSALTAAMERQGAAS
jgi:hypothetical protein